MVEGVPAPRVVVVATSDLSTQLAAGLFDAGASVAIVGPNAPEGAFASALDSRAEIERAFSAVAAARGSIDVVVCALEDPDEFVAAPIAGTTPRQWDERAEARLRRGLWCAQAAFTTLAPRGGRIIFVTPTVGLTGASGLVPEATAVEGLRAMAKSAARQWAAHGITVNCVAPGLEGAVDVRADIAPVVAMLAAESSRAVTGATIVVDGGTVMAP